MKKALQCEESSSKPRYYKYFQHGHDIIWRSGSPFVHNRRGWIAMLVVGGTIAPVLVPPSWTEIADVSWAACVIQPDNAHLCSGVSGGQVISAAAPLTIIADSTFNAANNSGDGIYINSSGAGIEFTQRSGSKIAGSSTGIYSELSAVGEINVAIAGDVIGGGDAAVWATNNALAGNITVTQAAGSIIEGFSIGIRAENYGVGSTSVTTAGIVNQIQTGASNLNTYGVYAFNAPSAKNIVLVQTGGSISGNAFGMFADNRGTGSTTIVSSGDVSAITLELPHKNRTFSGLSISAQELSWRLIS